MYSAIGVEPTKLTAWTRRSSRSASTASLSPLTTLSTPGGRPASTASCETRIALEGSRSEGFSTNVLPQTTAIGHIQSGTIAGKLKGVMPAVTPSAWCSLQESMFGPTFRLYSPFKSSGAYDANSTFSIPRWTSPIASPATLPCSAVRSAAISSECCSSRTLRRLITRARFSGAVARHAGKAFSADAIAASTVALSASRTRRSALPVAGS